MQKVSLHPVCARAIELFFAAIAEVVNARVLQEAAHY